jgi:hypothetical protein
MTQEWEALTLTVNLADGAILQYTPAGEQQTLRAAQSSGFFGGNKALEATIAEQTRLLNALYAEGWRLVSSQRYGEDLLLLYLERPVSPYSDSYQ